MRRYGIAKYLTLEQRQRAAAAEYELVPGRVHDSRCASPCVGGHPMVRLAGDPSVCPLGVAFGPEACDGSPSSVRVAALAAPDERRRPLVRICAERFIFDVDNGKLRPEDIPSALGVRV